VVAQLEVWKPDGRELVALDRERVTIGRADTSDVAVPSGGAESRAPHSDGRGRFPHAVLRVR
jgi:hypothetical protein